MDYEVTNIGEFLRAEKDFYLRTNALKPKSNIKKP